VGELDAIGPAGKANQKVLGESRAGSFLLQDREQSVNVPRWPSHERKWRWVGAYGMQAFGDPHEHLIRARVEPSEKTDGWEEHFPKEIVIG